MVGQLRKDELYQKRNAQIRDREELEEKERLQRQYRLEQRQFQREQRRERLRSQRQFRLEQTKERRQPRTTAASEGSNARRHADPEHVCIGLPEHLACLVLWVARKYRTNPLSHIPGRSDVVVEYHDERTFGYDWIKKPSVYISAFFAGIVEYASDDFKKLDEQRQIEVAKRKIARVFARKYKDESEYSTASFIEVWNSETSDEMPWKSLERFERTPLNQYDFEADYNFIPQSAFDHYGYEPDYIDFTRVLHHLSVDKCKDVLNHNFILEEFHIVFYGLGYKTKEVYLSKTRI